MTILYSNIDTTAQYTLGTVDNTSPWGTMAYMFTATALFSGNIIASASPGWSATADTSGNYRTISAVPANSYFWATQINTGTQSSTTAITASTLPLPTGAATDASLATITTILQNQRSETLWTDDSNAYFVRFDNGGTITWTTPVGGASTGPGTGARPSGGVSAIVDGSRYQATAAGTGFSIGDYLNHVVTADPTTGAVIGFFWINISTNTKLTVSPSSASITPVSALPTGAATASLQPAINGDGGSLSHVTNFPSTQAVMQSGTWNIGTITTLPSIPTGANTIGAVTQSGTWNMSLASLPAFASTPTFNQGTANTASNGWYIKITDGTNNNTIKAASTAAVTTDTSQVVALSPNSPVPTGSNIIGKFGIDQTTAGTTNGVVVNNTVTVHDPEVTTALAAPLLMKAMSVTVTDIASTTFTATGTGSTITIDGGSTYTAGINVTAWTTGWIDLVLQESPDGGTTWNDIYHMARIQATGTFTVPTMLLLGTRRWKWTTAASTSITFSIVATRGTGSAPIIRSFYDRTIVPNTLGSTTPAWLVSGCRNTQALVFNGSATTSAVFQMNMSADGTAFATAGSTITPGSNGVAMTATTTIEQWVRVAVSTAGSVNPTVAYVHIYATS